MAYDELFAGGHFPHTEAVSITYDWAHDAYESHARALADIQPIVAPKPPFSPTDPAPTIVDTTRDKHGDISVGITTPLLPEDFGQDLLAEPAVFYLDKLAALLCSHLFSIDMLASANSDDAGMIQPYVDLDAAASRSQQARLSFTKNVSSPEQKIFSLPNPIRTVAITRVSATGHYNYALKSRMTVLVFNEYA